GVSPYTSSFDFAETCVFGKQSLGPFHCGHLRLIPRRDFTLLWRPFSRSYGAILPSSFSRVLPIALVFSTCPPVSVLVRARPTSLDAFLGGMASATSRCCARHPVSGCVGDGFPYLPPYAVTPGRPSPGLASLPRPAIGDSGGDVVQEYQPVVHRLRLS